MSREAVTGVMGTPRSTEVCGPGIFAPDKLDRCFETDVYPDSFAPLQPEYWVIWFNRDRRVIDKYYFQSP